MNPAIDAFVRRSDGAIMVRTERGYEPAADLAAAGVTLGSAPAILAGGRAINTSGTSAYEDIPLTSSGARPTKVRLACTAACHVRFGHGGDGAATASLQAVSGVVGTAGTGHMTGDVLTLAGGTAVTAAKVTVATAKVAAATSNAPGSGYDVADLITASGGTHTTAAVLSVATLKLVSAVKNAIGTGYAPSDTITLAGGTAGTKAVLTLTTTALASAAVNAPGTGYVPGDTIVPAGGTHTGSPLLTVTHTQVVSATVVDGGTGGTPGAVTITGTTGTGTQFQATGTIGGDGILAGPLVVSVAGDYTVNPTDILIEPVTGGALTGCTVILVMGALTVTAAGGAYTVNSATLTQGSTSGIGAGATFNTVAYGVDTFTISEAGNYTVKSATFTQDATSGGGSGATFQTALYGVRTVTVSNAGDYSVSSATLTQASVAPAGGTGATFNAVSYGVKTVSINTPGEYSVLPANDVAQGASTGTGINAAITMTWGVGPLTITNPGVGYLPSDAGDFSFTGGGGSGASLTATFDADGGITSFVVVPGTGYTTVPTVVIPAEVVAVATDMLLNAGASETVATGGRSHIAAIQAAAGGVLQISPIENT